MHTFVGGVGDIVLLRLGETTSSLEPVLTLTGPTSEYYHDSANALAEITTTPLEHNGVYTITVSDNDHNDTGGYSLHIQRINGPAGAVSLDFGTTQSGSLPTAATTAAYTLSGDAGDRVLLRMAEEVTNSYLGPRLRVYQTDGTLVAEVYGGYVAELNTLELPATATYTVLALDNVGIYTGGYFLHCQRTNDPVSAVHDPDGWEVPVAALALHDCSPNPFNPATTVHFDLPKAAEVRLVVYSLSGRRLTTLVNGTMPAGRHGVVWRGIDDRGRQAASGIYLIRLQVAGKQFVTKTTLLK